MLNQEFRYNINYENGFVFITFLKYDNTNKITASLSIH